MSNILGAVDIAIACVVGIPIFFVGTACVGMTHYPKSMWYQPFLGYGIVFGVSFVACSIVSNIVRGTVYGISRLL